MSVLNISQIMEILPHRQPMLLIDSVEEIEYGVRAVAKKCVSFNEPFFAGHFPEEPVMPGVLIVEALAQTGAVAILGKDENRGKTAYFASINSAKFKRKVVPGDILTLETEIIKVKGPIGVGKRRQKSEMKLHALQKSPLQLSNRIERHYIEAVTERKYYASNFEKKKADIHKT